jgi:hypothetical protein
MKRRERDEYAKALVSLKRWAREDRPEDWTEREWGTLVERISSQKSAARESSRFPLLRPLVSAAAALIVLVWAAIFLSKARPADLSARNSAGPAEIAAPASEDSRPRSEIVTPEPAGPGESAISAESAASRSSSRLEARRLLASASQTPRPNDNKPAFTWISPETGLTIVWFTNNNLKLEDLP